MKVKSIIYIFSILAIIIYFIFYYKGQFCFKIEDNNCTKKEFYFDSNSERVYSMDIRIKGNISSDSIVVNLNNYNIDYKKYQNDLSFKFHKGEIDTILIDNDWYNDKGQIEYLPFSNKGICNNELKIKIKLHKTII